MIKRNFLFSAFGYAIILSAEFVLGMFDTTKADGERMRHVLSFSVSSHPDDDHLIRIVSVTVPCVCLSIGACKIGVQP